MSTLNIYFKKGYGEGIKIAKVDTLRNLLLANKYTTAEIGDFIKVTEAFVCKVMVTIYNEAVTAGNSDENFKPFTRLKN